MKTKPINFPLFILLTLLLSCKSMAQELFVYHFLGDVTYSDSKKGSNPIFFNYKLLSSTSFKLGNNAELILRDNDFNLLLIKKEGSYAANQLIDFYKSRGESKNFAKTTLSFMASEMVSSDQDIRKHASRNLKQSGGVSRGTPCLMLLPLDGQLIAEPVLTFVWNEDFQGATYDFQIYEPSDELVNEKVLYFLEVKKDTVFSVKTADLPFIKKDKDYVWSVSTAGEPNEVRLTFKLTSKEEIQKLTDSIMQSVDKSMSETDQLVELANLYEAAGLYQQSIDCYQQAFELTKIPVYLNLIKLLIARHSYD